MNANPTRPQSRVVGIVAIAAIIVGLIVGLIWATLNTWSPSLFAGSGTQNTANVPAPSQGNGGRNKPSAPGTQSTSTPATIAATQLTATPPTAPAAPNPTAEANSSDIFPSSGISGNTGEAAGDNNNNMNSTANGTTNNNAAPNATNPPVATTPAKPKRAAASGTPAANTPAKGSGKGTAMAAAAYIPIGGVVDRLSGDALVIDTGVGPITATLAATGTLERLPIPGDAAGAKVGKIASSDVQVGSYATVYIARDQIPAQVLNPQGKKAAPQATPQATPSSQQNVKNLIARKFGLGAGFNATVAAIRIGPAPAGIDDTAGYAGRVKPQAMPVSLVSVNNDGSLTVTVTKYGNVNAIIGPGTQVDRLGQPIKISDLKPGDNLLLYGANVANGDMIKGKRGKTVKGVNQSKLPFTIHLASIHLVTPNEHFLQGKVSNITSSGFQITTANKETMNVTVDRSTVYQSLVANQSLGSLSDLKDGSNVVVYTLDDTDIDPSVYKAKSVYTVPNARQQQK